MAAGGVAAADEVLGAGAAVLDPVVVVAPVARFGRLAFFAFDPPGAEDPDEADDPEAGSPVVPDGRCASLVPAPDPVPPRPTAR